jgi:dienelactone hydrolase
MGAGPPRHWAPFTVPRNTSPVVSSTAPILSALIALFEAEWARASPIPGITTPAADAGGPPDAETATLLAMLAAGMTDASIARSLSRSMRTTQRRMRQLMSDLGATSRFQAGVAARERGWLYGEYPDAGHGFLNQFGGTTGVLVTVMGRLMGVGYHEPSAADARRRIIDFFDSYLKKS